MLEVDREKFITLCEDNDIVPVPDYAGRGMFDRRCIGIDIKNYGQLARFFTTILQQIDPDTDLSDRDEPLVSPEWEGMTTDHLGRGIIVYWPSVQAVNAEDMSATK